MIDQDSCCQRLCKVLHAIVRIYTNNHLYACHDPYDLPMITVRIVMYPTVYTLMGSTKRKVNLFLLRFLVLTVMASLLDQ